MDINILLFILQVLSGGTAGYITNKYAVNMLFTEYKPLKFLGCSSIKLGGVIKKNKEKFIEEVSNLVEKDIINASTIKDSIKTEEFKNEILKTAQTFIKDSLILNSRNILLKDSKGFLDTKEGILKFISKAEDNVLDEIIDQNINKFTIDELIDDRQISKIGDFLYNLILKETENNGIIENSFEKSYDDISQYAIEDICSQSLKKNIIENIQKEIDEFDQEKICDILNDGGIHNILSAFVQRITDKSISDIIDKDSEERITQHLSDQIRKYIHSDSAETDIESIINKIISVLKDMDYTVYEIAGNDFALKINAFLKDNIEKFVPYISEWIRKNKSEIDKMIEDSIDEALDGMDTSIKKMIITKVRESFLNDVSSKSGIVEKIIAYIESLGSSDDACNKIYEALIKFLKENKIKDIVKKAEKTGIINETFIKKVSYFIIKKIDENSSKASLMMIQRLKKNKISAFINISSEEGKLDQYTKKLAYFIKNILKNNLPEVLDNMFNQKISAFISKEQSYLKFKDYIENSREMICKVIKEKIQKTDLTSDKEKIKESAHKIILDYSERKIDEYSKESLSLIIEDNIKNKDDISNYIGNEVLNYIYAELDEILDKRVKKIVKDNLMMYDEDQILNLADRFMGKELRPISIFGAILGAAAGFIFAFFSRNIGIDGFYNNIFSSVSSIFLMGFVGVITNVIAIWMLFHPYKQNRFLKKIPFFKYFSLGYIPAHKKNLASGISNVIDSDLLNSDKLKCLFEKKKDNIVCQSFKALETDNYKKVLCFIKNKKDKILSFILKKTDELNIKNAQKNAQKISDLDLEHFINDISIDENVIKDILRQKLKEYLDEGLKDVLTEQKLLEYVQKFNIADELKNSDVYSNLLKKSLSDIFTDQKSSDIKKNIIEKIDSSVLDNASEILKNEFEKFLSEKMDNDKSIDTIFDGNIKSIIDKNLNSITMFLAGKANSYIASNKEKIKVIVINKITESLNFFEKFAYSAAGGDAIVSNTIDIMIDKKLVSFIGLKFDEIKNVINDILCQKVYPVKISTLKVKTDEFNFDNMFNTLGSELSSDYELRNKIDEKIKIVLDKAFSEKLSFYAGMLNISSKELITDKFSSEFDILNASILQNVKQNVSKVTKDLNENIKLISSCSFKNIDISQFEYTTDKLSDIIKSVSKDTLSIASDLKSMKIGDVLDRDVFDKKLQDIILRFSIDKTSFEKVFDMVIDDKLSFISDDIKEKLSKVVLYSAASATEQHLKEIIIKTDLKDIAVKEIMLMEPKTIDDLFRSFAGDYYNRLYRYGAVGAIFGINIYVSVIAFIAESVNELLKQRGGKVFEK